MALPKTNKIKKQTPLLMTNFFLTRNFVPWSEMISILKVLKTDFVFECNENSSCVIYILRKVLQKCIVYV